MDESDLIRKAQEGDEGAFSSIIGEHETTLRGVAFKILKDDDDVDDALQTVRIKVWKKIRTFDPGKGTKLSTWLHTITKNTCLDQIKKNKAGASETEREDEAGGERTIPTGKNGWIEYEDDPRNILIGEEDERERTEKVKKAREIVRQAQTNFLSAAKEKIKKWPDAEQRKHGLRIASDPRIESFLDALHASAGKVGMGQYVGAVLFAAMCAEPIKETITREDARAAIKVLEYFGRNFHGAPAGSGLEAIPGSIETMLRMLRPIAIRPGTKTKIHQYDLITRLDLMFRKMCGPRRPADKAARILLGITYGGKWTPGILVSMKARAREVFPT